MLIEVFLVNQRNMILYALVLIVSWLFQIYLSLNLNYARSGSGSMSIIAHVVFQYNQTIFCTRNTWFAQLNSYITHAVRQH